MKEIVYDIIEAIFEQDEMTLLKKEIDNITIKPEEFQISIVKENSDIKALIKDKFDYLKTTSIIFYDFYTQN